MKGSAAGGVLVRRARPEDEGLVRRLVEDMEGYDFAPEPFSRRFGELLGDARRACFVVELDGSPAGYIALRVEHPLHHERPVAEVVELAVSPEARGQGLGAALLGHACDYARDEGCELIEVHSKVERTRAHRFYEREGMRKTHVHLTMPLRPAAPGDTGGMLP